jgi:multidrug efflux system membrane fusion protein
MNGTSSETLPGTSGKRRGWLVAAICLAVAVIVALAWRARGDGAQEAGAAQKSDKSGGGRSPGDRVVPVVVTPAAVRDVPIYLDGIGTVTAYKTVNLHSQVEGRLEKVAFREGQPVKQGELLAQIDPRPFTIALHQAQAALARDEAQLAGARRNLTRFEGVGEQLIARQQVDDQRALVDQLTATIASDRAQVENAKLQLSYARITSPIDGVTGVRQVDPGNIVHVADPTGIVVVTQMDPIAVLFTLPQDVLPDVAPAQAKEPLTVEARSRDGGQLLATGKLALVDNTINQGTATIRLKAIFPNPERALWPNQFVKARLRLAVREGALVIPAVAVQRGPQGTFVYLAGADGKAALAPVTVERIEGEDALIAQGGAVGAGAPVVTEGQNQLRPGAALQARTPQGKGTGPGGGPTPGGRDRKRP